MVLAYLITASLLGMFIAYQWSSAGFANTIIKILYTVFTVWSLFLVAAYFWRYVEHTAMRML